MNIHSIYGFFVEPGKGLEEPPEVIGKEIPKSGKLFEMLSDIFYDAEKECKINICFKLAADGSQENNVVHSLIVAYAQLPKLKYGKLIAERLRSFTTRRSNLGLLFLILGKENDEIKLVISRFPADKGILAEKSDKGLSLEFIERIFMKNPNYYKAALYSGKPIIKDLWSGFAVDKQSSLDDDELAQYWIQSFLDSDYMATSIGGTKRFASALLSASKTAKEVHIKAELTGIAMLVKGFNNKATTINKILDNFQISNEAKREIFNQLKFPEVADTTFVFNYEEFNSRAPYSIIELDNEGYLIAPTANFYQVFSRKLINETENLYQYSTQGRIVSEQLRGKV